MYVDTSVFMYAVGRASRYKEPCARILQVGAAETVVLVTSAETLQEVLHRYRSIGRESDIRTAFETIIASVKRVLPVTVEDIEEARQIGERTRRGSHVPARDLVHAAIAQRQGIREILTVDVHFASIPGVIVVDPLEWRD
jgi:uncharacterized protein